MSPSLCFLDKAFSPHVICPICNVASFMIQSSAHCSEAVSPLTASPCPCLQKLDWVIVSWKSNGYIAASALVPLNSPSMSLFSLLSGGLQSSCAVYLSIVSTARTLRLIAPGEELCLEPFKERFELVDLPLGLLYLNWYQREYNGL